MTVAAWIGQKNLEHIAKEFLVVQYVIKHWSEDIKMMEQGPEKGSRVGEGPRAQILWQVAEGAGDVYSLEQRTRSSSRRTLPLTKGIWKEVVARWVLVSSPW